MALNATNDPMLMSEITIVNKQLKMMLLTGIWKRRYTLLSHVESGKPWFRTNAKVCHAILAIAEIVIITISIKISTVIPVVALTEPVAF